MLSVLSGLQFLTLLVFKNVPKELAQQKSVSAVLKTLFEPPVGTLIAAMFSTFGRSTYTVGRQMNTDDSSQASTSSPHSSTCVPLLNLCSHVSYQRQCSGIPGICSLVSSNIFASP